MKVRMHLPPDAASKLDEFTLRVEMPSVPAVGDLIGIDRLADYLEVVNVRWEVTTSEILAESEGPDVFCEWHIVDAEVVQA